jgi:GntR family transcriptional regulator, arabinose operon transcriptional repressor
MSMTFERVKSQTPIYRQIEKQLRARIEAGEWQPGDRLPSVNELRQHFGGVNHLTVRQALKYLVEDGLVRAEHGRGTFVQRTRRLGRVAMVLPHLEDSLFLSIARGARRVLDEVGIKTLIFDSRGDGGDEADTFLHLEALALDGAIVFPVVDGDFSERVCRLKAQGFPFVLVDRALPDIDVPSVTVDNYQGGYDLATHLIERGRCRVAWMGESVSSSARARLDGVRDALNDAGLAMPRSRRVEAHTNGGPVTSGASYQLALKASVEVALSALLAQDPAPDAIACGNDATAILVLESLAARGVSVPQTIAVTGFDDVPAAETCRPALTTMRQPMEQLGEESARVLLSRLNRDESPSQKVLPVELVVRDST